MPSPFGETATPPPGPSRTGSPPATGHPHEPPLPVRTTTADVDQRPGVRRPLEIADRLAVVRRVMGDLPPAVLRRLGHPDVAGPLRVVDPGEPGPGRRGQQLLRKRRAQD